MKAKAESSEEPKTDVKTSQGRAPLTPLGDRRVVFISHANPEDNDITAWYGARLTAAGYEVWTDLTRLLGGEEMWLDIDDALRFRARKVIALLSTTSVDPQKEGVRAEIDRAAAFRKKLGDRRFLIPVRIDDVPFEDLPPTIGNRTVIDGQDPAASLATILEILSEDGVPRSATPSMDALLRWHQAFAPEHCQPEAVEDFLITNWYPVVSLPETVNFYEIKRPLKNAVKEPAIIASAHPLPMVAHWRRLVSFGDWDEVQEPIADTTPVKLDHTMRVEEFLNGGDDKVKLDWDAASKYLSSLIRQAFDRLAIDAGFLDFDLSERSTAWYVPKASIEGDKVTFERASGVPGWRQVYGVYGAREMNWHFGTAAQLKFGDPMRLKLTPHVIYTDPERKKPTTASYRRAHCKLWFNAKWRDLLYAYVKILADNNGMLVLPLAENASAAFNGMPIDLSLPVRPSIDVEKSVIKETAEDGDAADIDVSGLVSDPAFSKLLEDDDPAVKEEGDYEDVHSPAEEGQP